MLRMTNQEERTMNIKNCQEPYLWVLECLLNNFSVSFRGHRPISSSKDPNLKLNLNQTMIGYVCVAWDGVLNQIRQWGWMMDLEGLHQKTGQLPHEQVEYQIEFYDKHLTQSFSILHIIA